MNSDNTNSLLTIIPSQEEIYKFSFTFNKGGAYGPDGFGAYLYQSFWDVVKVDDISAMTKFFFHGWILSNFNVNTLILITKSSNAHSSEQYRPISMANIKFKIISKVIVDRLAQILPSIISKEQRGFGYDRNIRDCICFYF